MQFHSDRRMLRTPAMTSWLIAMFVSTSLGQAPVPRPNSGRVLQTRRVVRLEPVTEKIDRVVVTAVASDPRGELLAVAGDDHVIRIFEMETMRVRELLRVHRDLIRTLAFDTSGDRLVSAGNDGQLVVWRRGEPFEAAQILQGTPAMACVRFAPEPTENVFAAVGFASDIFIVGREQNPLPNLTCGCNDLRALAFRDDGLMLAAGGRSGELHLYDMSDGRLIREEKLHDGRIRDIAFGPDSNNVITAGEDGNVVIFDTVGLQVKHRVELPSGRCFSIAIIDSTQVAVAGSDDMIRIIDIDQGKVVQSLTGHDGSISSLTASGGVLYSGGYDGTIRRWELSADLADDRIAETESNSLDKK